MRREVTGRERKILIFLFSGVRHGANDEVWWCEIDKRRKLTENLLFINHYTKMMTHTFSVQSGLTKCKTMHQSQSNSVTKNNETKEKFQNLKNVKPPQKPKRLNSPVFDKSQLTIGLRSKLSLMRWNFHSMRIFPISNFVRKSTQHTIELPYQKDRKRERNPIFNFHQWSAFGCATIFAT